MFINPFDPAGPLLEHTPMPGGPILFHNFGRLFLGEPALFIGWNSKQKFWLALKNICASFQLLGISQLAVRSRRKSIVKNTFSAVTLHILLLRKNWWFHWVQFDIIFIFCVLLGMICLVSFDIIAFLSFRINIGSRRTEIFFDSILELSRTEMYYFFHNI